MKEVSNWSILPDDIAGKDTKTITTNLHTIDYEEHTNHDDCSMKWDVAVFERFCVDAMTKISEIKRNNGGK